MRTLELLAIISVVVLTAACSGVTEATPTGPSTLSVVPSPGPAAGQDYPSLIGRWRASATIVFRNLETGNTLSWSSCSGSFTVASQDGPTFKGPFGTAGGGWNADRFCTAFATLDGELLMPDGSVARARFEGESPNWPRPSVSPSCEFVSRGDGNWTGTATNDGIHLQMRDILRCAANVDGGIPGIPLADFERTVSLAFQR